MKTIPAVILASLLLCGVTATQAAEEAATKDVATGNMAEAVKVMDADHDGLISKDEYMTYEGKTYDADPSRVPSGNMSAAVKATEDSKRKAYLQDRETYYSKISANTNGGVKADEMVDYLKGPAKK